MNKQTEVELRPENRLQLDYADEAARLIRLPYPIIDVHSHLMGSEAISVYARVAEDFAIGRVYSMTPENQMAQVASRLGDRVRFIAIPDVEAADPVRAVGVDYQAALKRFYRQGVRIAKFWAAPRGRDWAIQRGSPANAFRLDSNHVQQSIKVACELGMALMVHVGDPDTWFATKYRESSKYGTKLQQYEPLQQVLDRYSTPTIAAHMGGWPENLDFLSQLLEQYPHLYLDCSATKWMVRELSRHPRTVRAEFFRRWQGRILFGSDIVTGDQHLRPQSQSTRDAPAADSIDRAYDLYASRYWALRILLESDYEGDSAIADPDLNLVDPEQFSTLDAPKLVGTGLKGDVLRWLYHDAATELLDALHD